MKIISKEPESKTIKQTPPPAAETKKGPATKVTPPESKPVSKPVSKPEVKKDVRVKVAIDQPKKKPKTPPSSAQKKPSPPKATEADRHQPGENYFASTYDRFISLIRFNITFKLALGYALRLVFLTAFLFFVIYGAFSYYLFYDAQKQLSGDLTYIEKRLMEDVAYDSIEIADFLTHRNLTFHVFDGQQALLYATAEIPASYESLSSIVEYDFTQFPSFPLIHEVHSVVLKDNTLLYLAVNTDMASQTSTLEATFPIGFVLCIALILTSIRSASKMSKKHLKPILVMTEQVKELSASNLSTRLNVSGTKDELKDLALTFNQMLNDIQKSYEREKQFVSDASHELRTPIAVIKGYAGMLNRWGKDDPAILEESIQAILGETENMHSLVESLLFIARNDKGSLKMDVTPFNLSELFTEIVKETRLIDTSHEIQETIDSDIIINGSADKLKQALRIFIDNSIKYTPDEGKIILSLRKSQQSIMIVISDNGIGISKEDLPHIFDRFYRADKSRTKLKENQHGGTGLGLSIAKIIIEQHLGQIHVDSALNEGTTFTLFLPAHEMA